MKRLIFLITLFAGIITGCLAQTNSINASHDTIKSYTGSKFLTLNDSVLFKFYLEAESTGIFPQARVGRIQIIPANGHLYQQTLAGRTRLDSTWTVVSIDTTSLSNRINSNVPKADSNSGINYTTNNRLKDSLSAHLALIVNRLQSSDTLKFAYLSKNQKFTGSDTMANALVVPELRMNSGGIIYGLNSAIYSTNDFVGSATEGENYFRIGANGYELYMLGLDSLLFTNTIGKGLMYHEDDKSVSGIPNGENKQFLMSNGELQSLSYEFLDSLNSQYITPRGDDLPLVLKSSYGDFRQTVGDGEIFTTIGGRYMTGVSDSSTGFILNDIPLGITKGIYGSVKMFVYKAEDENLFISFDHPLYLPNGITAPGGSINARYLTSTDDAEFGGNIHTTLGDGFVKSLSGDLVSSALYDTVVKAIEYSGLAATDSDYVFESPWSTCQVIGIRAWRDGGTTAFVNVQKDSSGTFKNLLSVNDTITTTKQNMATLQNTVLAYQNRLKVFITSITGTATKLYVQIYIRRQIQ